MPSWIFSPSDLHRVLVDLGLRQARVDEAEGDGVDVDLELAPLLGDRLGQADDAGLAGGVVGLAGVAEGARGRGHVDDLAEHLLAFLALLLGRLAQVRRGGADHAERHHGVDVEHRLELLVGHLVDRRVERVAGVVDDDVDLPERVDRRLRRAASGRPAWSGRRRTRPSRPAISPAACSATSPSRSLIRTCAPCCGEQLRGGAADPARRAGDDRRLAVEYSHSFRFSLSITVRGGYPSAAGEERAQAVMMTPKSCV